MNYLLQIWQFVSPYLTWQNLGWFTLASPLLLWAIFIPLYLILGRQKTRGSIHPVLRTIAIVLFILGAPLDVYVNLIWGTVIFWQRPSIYRLFLSARMDDLIRNGSGWRKARAVQVVGRFLEPFDATGQHTTYGLYTRT